MQQKLYNHVSLFGKIISKNFYDNILKKVMVLALFLSLYGVNKH